MHGLPADFNAQVFVGHELTYVTFGQYLVAFGFGDELRVNLTSSFVLQGTRYDVMEGPRPPLEAAGVISLIGLKVSLAAGRTDGTLTLTFENGWVLQFLDDYPNYESYIIKIGAQEIIV
jgi:hypothetical protein